MNRDIVVVGAGPAALSFARAMQSSALQLTLLEQAPEAPISDPQYDGRDIALTPCVACVVKRFRHLASHR